MAAYLTTARLPSATALASTQLSSQEALDRPSSHLWLQMGSLLHGEGAVTAKELAEALHG